MSTGGTCEFLAKNYRLPATARINLNGRGLLTFAVASEQHLEMEVCMRTRQPAGPQGGTAKVFMMLIEGDSTTVQRAVEAAERTITRSNGSGFRSAFSTPSPPAVATPAQILNSSEDHDEASETLEDQTPADTDAERTVPPRRPRAAPKPPPIATNLRENESPTLREFCAEANLHTDASDLDRTIVLAHWLRDTRQIAEFGASELYTAYGLMDWAVPTDVTSPMRNLKKGKQPKLTVKDGKWALTLFGEKRFRELKHGT